MDLKLNEEGFITGLQKQFVNQCNTGINDVLPYVIGLALSLMAIDIALSMLLHLEEQDPLKLLIKKIMKAGVVILIVKNWIYICDILLDSASWFGMKAGGLTTGAEERITDPSYIIDLGVTRCSDVIDSILAVSGDSIAAALSAILLKIVLILVIFCCFLFIGLQVFLTVAEFHIIKAVSVVMLPFGIVKQTRFLCEKAIGAIWSFTIKILVLAFMIAFSLQMVEAWNNIPAGKTAEILRALCGCVALALLVWQAPNIAQGLLSGTPSLDAGHAAGTALRAGGAAASVVTGGAAMAGAIYQAAKMPGPSGQTGGKQFGKNLLTMANQSINPFSRGRAGAQAKLETAAGLDGKGRENSTKDAAGTAGKAKVGFTGEGDGI